MAEKAELSEEQYQKRVRSLISRILEAAFKASDLKMFLNEIVKVGAEKMDAKSCVVFLLEEMADGDGRILRAYATSGEVGKILKEKQAWYYVPKRGSFKEDEEGEKRVEAYLKEHLKYVLGNEKMQRLDKNKEEKSLMNTLREHGKSLMDVVHAHSRAIGKTPQETLTDLVEEEKLPMGITAFVVKENVTKMLHREEIRNHPEWRGSYEGSHEICTSVVEVPLNKPQAETIGMIKIENPRHGKEFGNRHKELLMILADSAISAIQYILYREHTYKKIFGTKILKMIDKLKIEQSTSGRSPPSNLNQAIHHKIKEFYSDQLKIEIENIGGIDKIYSKITKLVSDIAQVFNLHATLGLLSSVGSAFESLLGTDVLYREHFMHQFQVFLLGHYLINKNSLLQQKLLRYLQKIGTSKIPPERYDVSDVLKVWFVASIFHDVAYSVGEIRKWLEKYFERVKVPPKFKIDWADMFAYFEVEKTKLVESISSKFDQPKDKIAVIIKDAFMNEKDHGVISGLVLMNVLQNKMDETLLTEICCAIMLHTDTVYSKFAKEFTDIKLEIDKFPFAFLLVLCDSAQKWGRPRVWTSKPDIDVKLEDVVTDDCTKKEIYPSHKEKNQAPTRGSGMSKATSQGDESPAQRTNGKIETRLRYQRITDEQKMTIDEKTLAATMHWYSTESLRFSITLYEDDEDEPFKEYTFPCVFTSPEEETSVPKNDKTPLRTKATQRAR